MSCDDILDGDTRVHLEGACDPPTRDNARRQRAKIIGHAGSRRGASREPRGSRVDPSRPCAI